MNKIILLLGLVVAILFVIKKILIPIVPEISINGIKSIEIDDLITIFEIVIFSLLVSSITIDEVINKLKFLIDHNKKIEHSHLPYMLGHSRYSDLLFFFVFTIGSLAVYVAAFAAISIIEKFKQ